MQEYNSILIDITETLESINIPIETGVFSETVPDEYLVITPMSDIFDLYADNLPQVETQEVRISLFTKNNYMARKNEITALLLKDEFIITDRRYLGFEEDTKYHHLAIDVLKEYNNLNI